MKKRFITPNLNESQLKRIEEIKFYLFVSKLTKKCNASLVQYNNNDVIQLLAELTKTDTIELLNAIIVLDKVQNKPNKEETAVAVKYLGLPYRFINKYVMPIRSFYNSLEDYDAKSTSEQIQTIVPRLEGNVFTQVQIFNERFKNEIYPIFKTIGEDYKSNERNETEWD